MPKVDTELVRLVAWFNLKGRQAQLARSRYPLIHPQGLGFDNNKGAQIKSRQPRGPRVGSGTLWLDSILRKCFKYRTKVALSPSTAVACAKLAVWERADNSLVLI